jgi:hypothetical protein
MKMKKTIIISPQELKDLSERKIDDISYDMKSDIKTQLWIEDDAMNVLVEYDKENMCYVAKDVIELNGIEYGKLLEFDDKTTTFYELLNELLKYEWSFQYSEYYN